MQERLFRAVARTIILVALTVLLGCASRSMMLVSRTPANTPLHLPHKITLAGQPNPRPDDEMLKAVLSSLLTEAGWQADSPTNAAYVMAYSMDRSWDEVGVPVIGTPPVQHVEMYSGHGGAPGRTVVSYEYREPFTSETGSRFLSTHGIRLVLYGKDTPAADRPQSVWEGYVELGSKVSPSQMTNALQQLLGKIGTNHLGRVPLPR